MTKRKEFFNLFNTLACIPNVIINKNALIYMRNDTWAAGKIVNADGYMNICLENVVYCDQKGLQYKLDNYAIRFRQILYIQIPESVKITTELEKYMEKLHNPAPTTQKKRTFKMKRALLGNQKTVDENKLK